MSKYRLHEVILPTDRWSARAVSPVDISEGVDTAKYGEVVLVHPGWAKSPERHAKFLVRLANNGFLPIGVDTRYAYADRQQPRSSVIFQPKTVGKSNPYFKVDGTGDNRGQYRRPTVLLEICRRLGIEKRSYIGHSDGGRISTLATAAEPEKVNELVVVNGAGTGDSSSGVQRLIRSNTNRVKEMLVDDSSILETTASALGSAAYALTHLRRTIAEKHVIQNTNTWEVIDSLGSNVGVTVLHAISDELISFEDCERKAQQRPNVVFIPTIGGHSNVYEPAIQDLVIASLQPKQDSKPL